MIVLNFRPLKTYSKGGCVDKYLKMGFQPLNLLKKSKSCYAGDNSGCGKCRSCLRKYVAIYNGDRILAEKLRHEMTADPRDFIEDFYIECIDKKRDMTEIKEVSRCITLR